MPVPDFYRLTMGMWGVFSGWAGYWTLTVADPSVRWYGTAWLCVMVLCAVVAIIGRDLTIRVGLAGVDVMLSLGMFLVVTDAEPFDAQFLVFALLAVNFIQVAGMLFSPLRGLSWTRH